MKYLSFTIKVLSLSFFLCCFSAYAVNLSTVDALPIKKSLPLSDYFTQIWNTHDGLPHNAINAISQTTDGYLWIGTWEGLARFNGRKFKVFTRGSKIGLPDSAIKSLTSTQEGKLLVAGARGGISERSNKLWSPMVSTSASTMINHAIYDKNENLWLALDGKGLIYRNKDSQENTIIIDDLEVYKIVQDDECIIWVATSKGVISVINKTMIRHFDESDGLPNSPAHTIILTKENELIVGTHQGAYKLVNGIFESLHSQLENERIISLLQDSDHNIWLGTNDHGIFKLSKNTLEQYDESDGLPNNRVSSLYQDKEQSIWVGTSNGLFRLREAPFITLTTKQGLSGNYIRSVLSHSNGSLWVGSSKGLNKIQKGLITTIKLPHSNEQLSVLSLAETSNQQVLVGTYNQGLYIVTDNQLQKLLTTDEGLPSNEIRSILVDSTKNLWLGTGLGVIKIAPDNTKEVFNKQSGLPSNFIMALVEDNDGTIWIGTGDGIASYSKGSLKTYSLDDKFDANYAFGFHVEQNSIWMATDRGLIHLDLMTSEVSAVTKENGLPVDKIFQIVIDNNNTFWLSSNRGVISVTREQVNNVIQGNSNTIDYNLFAEGVGLLSPQASGASTPAATLHHDGSVWIATAKGVSHINHERLQRMTETALPVVIEQLNVDGKSYPLLPTVELPEGASRITIHYAGIGFLMAKHIEYQTQLIGFDTQWQNKKNQTFTEFTNLAPGNYTFQMRAKYPNGHWQDNIASINFTVTPFYWQTTLFKLFVVLSICVALYCIYRYRIISIKRIQIRLENLVTQQTTELQKQTELFAYQANHDQLTGLFNRRAFDNWCHDDFEKAKLNNQPLTMAILDIDHFKSVNDEHSHMVGDQVIKRVASTLQKLVQESSYQVKLARWGGEEFTLLINNDQKKAYDFCELLRTSIKSHDLSDIAQALNITVSIGLTDNNEVIDYDKMISHADQALYFAKRHGRNQVKIYQKNDIHSNEKIDERIELVTRANSRVEPRKNK